MPRQPLPLGSWGRIRTQVAKEDAKGRSLSVWARANFRDHDGKVRVVSAFGKNKTTAEANLLKKLKARSAASQAGELTAMDKVSKAMDLWDQKFAALVAEGHRSPTSLDTYRRAINNHLRPAVGELHLGEATTPRIDRVITDIKTKAGAPTARTCRSIISGVMNLAVRYGAISVNPVREVDRIEHHAKKLPRALGADEVRLVRTHLANDESAIKADLPDLVTFMLGTGARIGEALAVLWHQADLETGRVKITNTIVRVKGEGLLSKTTKSKAGQRELAIPNWLLVVLRRRFAAGVRLDEPVFPDTNGGYRDPSNVRRSLRTSLSPVGSTARRDLGLTLRAARREAGMTRKAVADALAWPQTKVELIETGRIKVDRWMITDLVRPYGLALDDSLALASQLDAATEPADADTLSWITSHVFRKTTATALDDHGQTARQVADHLGHAKISMTQDNYLDRQSTNPAAAEALQRAFDPDLE
ncbi:tyrosine-type recombinase/integrase [Kribbella italica]|uniref:Integrase n=1 Tax=Kribbella italica TaxID=1540520 RepID=A0A7W9J115_9ACTN|nr:tyrosine-type recombinase/integrase [Kribbella italica]MBB5833319.1 integrase [Kribbella italica]